MDDDLALKICVAGPCKAGKTLLCRALADQPLFLNEYQPTAAVRVQTTSRTVGVDDVRIELWDCSGSPQYQAYWEVLAKDLDGIIFVMDPSRPEQERELESLYVAFAQANSLTTRQCMVLAVQAVKEGSYGLGGWGGLQGRLKALQLQGYVGINPATPGPGVQEANLLLDKLLSGCVAVRKEAMEQTYVDDEA